MCKWSWGSCWVSYFRNKKSMPPSLNLWVTSVTNGTPHSSSWYSSKGSIEYTQILHLLSELWPKHSRSEWWNSSSLCCCVWSSASMAAIHHIRMQTTTLHSTVLLAVKGHMDIVKFLTMEKHCDPMCKSSDQYTPLHWAAQYGHIDVVKFLTLDMHCMWPNV